jgi:O-methyltransferase
MHSHLTTPPIAVSVPTDPTPRDPAELYLDLMKKALTRSLIAKGMERHTIVPRGPKSKLVHAFNRMAAGLGLELVRLQRSTPEDYLESGHEASNRVEDAETMLGTRQLDHVQKCIVDVLDRNIAGDVLEAGVWRGGMTIFMRAALRAYGSTTRTVWVVDSFAGLPPIDRANEKFAWRRGDMAVSLGEVRDNFARYGLLDEQVKFLQGFFSDTLPDAPIRELSILRVDADLYQSTLDVLRNLYQKLSPGGYAIFDDYQNLPDCRRAVDEFRSEHGIPEEVRPIDDRAVYWQKRA